MSLVVKERVAAAGIDPFMYSGHSLRAGLATSAAQAGVSTWKIRQQTGHASVAMLIRYIRDGGFMLSTTGSSDGWHGHIASVMDASSFLLGRRNGLSE